MIDKKDFDKRLSKPNFQQHFVGTVEDNEDPEKIGRLKIRVLEIYGSLPVDHLPWAHPCSPFGGGANYGWFFIPPVGSKVKIRFPRHHTWFPEWYGTHWFKGEAPEESQITPPENHVLKTPKGYLIDIHDKNEYIRIKDPNGNFIIIDTSGDDLLIRIKNDRLEQVDGNSDETILGSKRFSTLGNFDIRSTGPINIRSSTAIYMDAPIIQQNSGLAQPQKPLAPQDVTHKTQALFQVLGNLSAVASQAGFSDLGALADIQNVDLESLTSSIGDLGSLANLQDLASAIDLGELGSTIQNLDISSLGDLGSLVNLNNVNIEQLAEALGVPKQITLTQTTS